MHPPATSQKKTGRRGWPAALVCAAGLLAGCAGFVPQPGPGAEPAARYTPLTLPFVALGDTQEHEATGYPMLDNDSTVDAFVEVAQRPPEQPLFGRRLMEKVLGSHVDEPFVHLGDVMDMSCRSEAQRMAKIFAQAGRPGAILPGNHDGLMFGIYGYQLIDAVLDPDARRWNRACRRGAGPDKPTGDPTGSPTGKSDREAFSKRDFISFYLSQYAQWQSVVPGLKPLPASGDQRMSWRNPDRNGFMSAIEARVLDGYAYADSYLAQRLKLPRAPGATRDVYLVGLDTNQAGPLVSTWDALMGRSPGSMGHVHPDQLRAIRPWIDEAIGKGDVVILAGHHNWRSLGLPSRILLRELMSDLRQPLVYLSAHTHRGFWALHRELSRRPLLELNVSSLSDWPLAYRRISFAIDESSRRLMVRGELHPRADRPIGNDADLLAAWQAKACEPLGPVWQDLVRVDRELVAQQRAQRGTLVDWALSAMASVCERCEQPLYEHAQAYQDDLLEAILQLSRDLGPAAHQLHTLTLPDGCDGADFSDCAQRLRRETPQDFQSHVLLFRRKAELVERLASHLDDLRTPAAVDYMSCRAVLAARVDFELTDEDRNNHRSEAKRHAEQFFRIEASVGLE